MISLQGMAFVKFFFKYCEEEKIKGLLVGVDAKKAFDSVDHKYMQEVLKAYGFGPKFKNWVQILNKNLTANILVNGFRTDKIKPFLPSL